MPVKNETGNRYGKLVVINKIDKKFNSKERSAKWLCLCDCGKEIVTRGSALRTGHTRSCGCLKYELFTTHGLSSHPLYGTWRQMLQRCYNKKHRAFENYGEKKIEVFQAWHDPKVFINWIEENLGQRPEGYSLDRINVYGNYEPGNLKWASSQEQVNNRRLVLLTEEEYKVIFKMRDKRSATTET